MEAQWSMKAMRERKEKQVRAYSCNLHAYYLCLFIDTPRRGELNRGSSGSFQMITYSEMKSLVISASNLYLYVSFSNIVHIKQDNYIISYLYSLCRFRSW